MDEAIKNFEKKIKIHISNSKFWTILVTEMILKMQKKALVFLIIRLIKVQKVYHSF